MVLGHKMSNNTRSKVDKFKEQMAKAFLMICVSVAQYGLVSGLVNGKYLVCIMRATTAVWFG